MAREANNSEQTLLWDELGEIIPAIQSNSALHFNEGFEHFLPLIISPKGRPGAFKAMKVRAGKKIPPKREIWKWGALKGGKCQANKLII